MARWRDNVLASPPVHKDLRQRHAECHTRAKRHKNQKASAEIERVTYQVPVRVAGDYTTQQLHTKSLPGHTCRQSKCAGECPVPTAAHQWPAQLPRQQQTPRIPAHALCWLKRRRRTAMGGHSAAVDEVFLRPLRRTVPGIRSGMLVGRVQSVCTIAGRQSFSAGYGWRNQPTCAVKCSCRTVVNVLA